MQSSCSVCKPFTNFQVTINPTDFPETCGTLRQNILPITASISELGTFPAVTIPVRIGTYSYQLNISDESTNNTGTFSNQNPLGSFTVNFTNLGDRGTTGIGPCGNTTITFYNATHNTVVINGNTYNLSLLECCDGGPGIRVSFSQSRQVIVSSDGGNIIIGNPDTNLAFCPCECESSCNDAGNSTCEKVPIPQLNIIAQTTMDGTDIGEINFVIRDVFNYKESHPPCDQWARDNTCATRYVPRGEVIASCFRECCPFIAKVVRGEGCTLRQKALSIYPGQQESGITFDIFYSRLIAYASLKLALFRVLTGKFNIKYLLRKYNKAFLQKLSTSRFCSFANIFLNCESDIYGYDQYFL